MNPSPTPDDHDHPVEEDPLDGLADPDHDSDLLPPIAPTLDGDTYISAEHALHELATLRQAWRGDPLTSLTLITSLIEQLRRFYPEIVTQARHAGASWEEIAFTLATSPTDAYQRYDPTSPVVDDREPYDPYD